MTQQRAGSTTAAGMLIIDVDNGGRVRRAARKFAPILISADLDYPWLFFQERGDQ